MSEEKNLTSTLIAQIDELKRLLGDDHVYIGSEETLNIDNNKSEIGENDFVKWMSESDLAEGMQTAYLYLLKSIPSSLGYDSPFTKKSLFDFNEYFEKLKNDPFYADAVPSVGAGALRSALNKYKTYLEERTMGQYTRDRLAFLLKEWYTKKPIESKVAPSMIGFGFKYGASLKSQGIKSRDLLNAAEIEGTLEAYINSGIDFYFAVKKSSAGISFASNDESAEKKLVLQTGLSHEYEWNRIIFGAPGTGKSFTLKQDENSFVANGGESERVTFHPDYTYAQFVGTYKPRMKSNGDIEYAFVPGPLTRALVKAYKSGMSKNPHRVLLIVEEINRANMAAVFGDIFQLLDRENGLSIYPIQASEDMRRYLEEELGISVATLQFPDNFYIWASMNSADQGVFPMDTAFKRRWEFQYIGIDEKCSEISEKYVKIGTKTVEWNSLRKAINSRLAALNINEDKQLGPFFIAKNIVVPKDGVIINSEEFAKAFKNKVIMYLFEDAARQRRSKVFSESFKEDLRYSEICDRFDTDGIDIFCTEIVKNVVIKENENSESEQQSSHLSQPMNEGDNNS